MIKKTAKELGKKLIENFIGCSPLINPKIFLSEKFESKINYIGDKNLIDFIKASIDEVNMSIPPLTSYTKEQLDQFLNSYPSREIIAKNPIFRENSFLLRKTFNTMVFIIISDQFSDYLKKCKQTEQLEKITKFKDKYNLHNNTKTVEVKQENIQNTSKEEQKNNEKNKEIIKEVKMDWENYSGKNEKILQLSQKIKEVISSQDEKVVNLLTQILNNHFKNNLETEEISDKCFSAIEKILSLCEVKKINNEIVKTSNEIQLSAQRLSVINTLLNERQSIENDLIQARQEVSKIVTETSETLEELPKKVVSVEELINDGIFRIENQGIMTYDNKNTKRISKNINDILDSLKELFPKDEHNEILEIIKQAAATVLNSNKKKIDASIQILTDAFNEVLREGDQVQDILAEDDLGKKLNLEFRDGKYILPTKEDELTKISRYFVKELYKQKPSQLVSLNEDRWKKIKTTLNEIFPNNEGAINEFTLLLLESNAEVLKVNMLENLKKTIGNIRNALVKNNLNDITSVLDDVSILRSNVNAQNTLSESRKNEGAKFFNENNSQNYEEILKILSENFDNSTVKNILSSNLAILNIEPNTLKTIFNLARKQEGGLDSFIRRLNPCLTYLASGSFETTKAGKPKGGKRNTVISRSIEVTIKELDKDYETTEIDASQLELLNNLFMNLKKANADSKKPPIIGGQSPTNNNGKEGKNNSKLPIALDEIDEILIGYADTQLTSLLNRSQKDKLSELLMANKIILNKKGSDKKPLENLSDLISILPPEVQTEIKLSMFLLDMANFKDARNNEQSNLYDDLKGDDVLNKIVKFSKMVNGYEKFVEGNLNAINECIEQIEKEKQNLKGQINSSSTDEEYKLLNSKIEYYMDLQNFLTVFVEEGGLYNEKMKDGKVFIDEIVQNVTEELNKEIKNKQDSIPLLENLMSLNENDPKVQQIIQELKSHFSDPHSNLSEKGQAYKNFLDGLGHGKE